jgi:hypothetical protein
MSGKPGPQQGSIAHLVSAPVGNEINEFDNLVFLCVNHHAQLRKDALNIEQVKTARAAMYKAITTEESVSPPSPPERQDFEARVADVVRSQFAERFGDFFALRKNCFYPGHSGVSHEVDLSAEFTVAGLKYLTIFEIKYRTGPLGVQDIFEFSARSKDIGADKAVLISNAGFSASALRLAKNEGIALVMVDRTTGKFATV